MKNEISPNSGADASKASKSSPYDINEGRRDDGMLLPSIEDGIFGQPLVIRDLASFQNAYNQIFGTEQKSSFQAALENLGIAKSYGYETAKALGTPPNAFSYGRISFAPDTAVNGGILAWPGIAPDAMRKVVRENIAPQFIIGMRVDDVLRYSELSDQVWKPGWRIEHTDKNEKNTEKLKGEIEEAQRFILNCNIETSAVDVRKRDAARLTSFKRFLSTIVRDSLTFDGIAVWTDMGHDEKVKAFAALPAGNIRLTTKEGYNGDPNKFAVAVDEGGTVVQAFSRDELTFYVRNPRSDPEAFGYGLSEVELSIRIISAFQNALDLNSNTFDRNSLPNAIVTISGNAATQRQLDLLNRLFTNMKRGITKFWNLPVIGLPEKAELKINDLSMIKGNEGYYKEFMNMLMGALCTVWRFPVRRLGYRISGGPRDAEPIPENSTLKMDEDDPGLSPLLGHLETLINEYVLNTRWPHLRFRFTGSSPSQDSREYELRTLAETFAERRKEARLPTLESQVPKELKSLAKLMEMCPSDPNMGGPFGNLASSFIGDDGDSDDSGSENKQRGNRMTSKIDPAKSETHGHASGVRRDSKAETQSAERNK